jgi:hypothetical protein
MTAKRFPPLALLAGSIVAALATTSSVYANTIIADGTVCTLADAITSANTDTSVGNCNAGSGADTIVIGYATHSFTAELPAIVSDIAFLAPVVSPLPNILPTVNGDGTHRLFFIGDDTHAPTVSFTGNSILTLNGGVAQGGNGTKGAGAGAGLGGGLFIYDGNVSVNGVTFNNNSASGGSSSGTTVSISGSGSDGGGGMSGGGGAGAGAGFGVGGPGASTGFGGGGGGGGNANTESGGGGGMGGGAFGGSGGAGATSGNSATAGGLGAFGGGGGGGGAAFSSPSSSQPGGPGGFGGGGGAGGSSNSNLFGYGGAGGFGGGGGTHGIGEGGGGVSVGAGGFGGGDAKFGGGGGGGGFGGAIFVRSGNLDLQNSSFTTNSANHGSSPTGNPGLGKGGVLFAISDLTNSNDNNQGMPTALPKVTGCMNTFSGSSANDAGGTPRDNADTFGVDAVGLTLACNDRIFADGFGMP